MRYNLKNEHEAKEAREYLAKLLSQNACIEIIHKHPRRSLGQNNYVHLLLSCCALECSLSLDEFKLGIFKAIINKDLFMSRDNNDKLNLQYTKVKSTADLTTHEMSIAVDRLKKFAAEKMDLLLPDANEYDKLSNIYNKIERNRNWL